MRDWLQALHDELLARDAPVVRVVVATVRGSAPREPGACMLVSATGEAGTIGGGHLEFVATHTARDWLASPVPARLDRFSLGASLGQCCGGIVELWFQRHDAREVPSLARALQQRASGAAAVMASAAAAEGGAAPRWLGLEAALREGAVDLARHDAVVVRQATGPVLYERIAPRDTPLWLFGAGHVARALVPVLAPLPFAITWVDSREAMFPPGLPANVRAIHSPQPADEVREIPAGAWALVMTHSHAEDFALCEALLRHGRFGWAGLIGSAPKAARFRQRLLQRGHAPREIARLVTPIGIDGIRSKEAAAIAVAVAAQLLQLREARPGREDTGAADSMAMTAREP
jgi:xanthine dehydrogenase accessory factor